MTRLITAEVLAGRLVIVDVPDKVRKNPISAIPKSNQQGKFCLIVNLSAPQGASANDGINAKFWSLEYASVEQAANLV